MNNSETVGDLVTRAAQALGEHADCVLILASWNEGGETIFRFSGVGNQFARLGMAQNYLEYDRSCEIARAIKDTKGE